ncbi:unnamed protein product [Closterium sp. NIES-54]
MLLAPEGHPDAPDIPTARSYAEAIAGEYSSQWQTTMDAEMASWKSTGTYVDEVPPPGANIVDGMWIFRVKRVRGSPPVFKARYVARGFSRCLDPQDAVQTPMTSTRRPGSRGDAQLGGQLPRTPSIRPERQPGVQGGVLLLGALQPGALQLGALAVAPVPTAAGRLQPPHIRPQGWLRQSEDGALQRSR